MLERDLIYMIYSYKYAHNGIVLEKRIASVLDYARLTLARVSAGLVPFRIKRRKNRSQFNNHSTRHDNIAWDITYRMHKYMLTSR